MLKKIKLKGSLKIIEDGERAVVKINAITGDVWVDFGYWLEGISFMANQAMISQNMTKNEIISYTEKYLQESIKELE